MAAFCCTGPTLQPNTPYNIGAPDNCRIDNVTNHLYCPQPTGSGSTPPEQFIFSSPDMSSTPIKPGQQMLMKSVQTGKWCRVLLDGKVMCDLDSSAGAAVLGYTGTGGKLGPGCC